MSTPAMTPATYVALGDVENVNSIAQDDVGQRLPPHDTETGIVLTRTSVLNTEWEEAMDVTTMDIDTVLEEAMSVTPMEMTTLC
jgi:hypothetical protein